MATIDLTGLRAVVFDTDGVVTEHRPRARGRVEARVRCLLARPFHPVRHPGRLPALRRRPSAAEAAVRLERDGANLLPQKPPVPLWRRVLAQLRDPLLAVAGAFALQLAGLYVPPLRELLSTEPLALGDLLIVTTLSTLGYAAVRLDRILHPSRRRRLGARPEFKVTAVRPTASSKASETGPRVSSSMGLISSAAGKLMRHGRTSRRRR